MLTVGSLFAGIGGFDLGLERAGMRMSQSQTDAVLRILRARWVTPLDALLEVGCMRLAARVYDLERKGPRIERKPIEHEGKRVMAYRIV